MRRAGRHVQRERITILLFQPRMHIGVSAACKAACGAVLPCRAVGGYAAGGRHPYGEPPGGGSGSVAAGPTRAARLAPYVADHEGVTSPLTRHVAEAERHTLVKAAGGRAW